MDAAGRPRSRSPAGGPPPPRGDAGRPQPRGLSCPPPLSPLPAGPGRGRRGRGPPGTEAMLAAHTLEYFVADSHLVAAGEPVFLYRDYIPLREPVRDVTPSPLPVSAKRSPYAAYR